MAKLTLTDLANLQNEQTAVAAVNANNALIEAALENTISRDGTTPNAMTADLDMNSNRILNLPTPTQPTEPLRLEDLTDFTDVGTLNIGQLSPYVSNDTQWGIDGTGNVDDTEALTTFLMAAARAKSLAIIVPGTYLITPQADNSPSDWDSEYSDSAVDTPGDAAIGLRPEDTSEELELSVYAQGAIFTHTGGGYAVSAYRLRKFHWYGGTFNGAGVAQSNTTEPAAMNIIRCANVLVDSVIVRDEYRGLECLKSANATFRNCTATNCQYFGQYMSGWLDVVLAGDLSGIETASGFNTIENGTGYANGLGSFFGSQARVINCWSYCCDTTISPTTLGAHFIGQDGPVEFIGGGYWEPANQNSGTEIDGIIIGPTGSAQISAMSPSRSKVMGMRLNGGRHCLYLSGSSDVDIGYNKFERYYLSAINAVAYFSSPDTYIIRGLRVFNNDVNPRISSSTVSPGTREVRAGIHVEGYNSIECDCEIFGNEVDYNARGTDNTVTVPFYDIYCAGLTTTSRVEDNRLRGSGDQSIPRQSRAKLLNQGRLSKSSSDLLFQPYHGNKIAIGGTNVNIPSTGAKLAPAGQSAGLKYIYGQYDVSTIIQASRTTNVATLVFGANHSFVVGSGITVDLVASGSVDTGFVGDYIVTAVPSATSISYANTGSDVTLQGALGRVKGITLTASATVPAADGVTGMLVKSNDATKYLLGTSTVDGGPNWTEVSDRLVASATELSTGTEDYKFLTPVTVKAALDTKVSSATLASYAPLASPTFTGTPLAPTAAVDTDTTQIATTAFVLAQDRKTLVNNQTNDYTLVLTDAGKVVEMEKGSGNTLTVPANATVAFPTGTVIEIVQTGAGQTTIAAAGGVTIKSAGTRLKLVQQYSAATLYKRATNDWLLSGDLTA